MAKLALLFLVVFFIGLQVAYCDVAEDVKAGVEKAGDSLTVAFDKAKEGFDKIFTKENIDKWQDSAKAFGDDISKTLKNAFDAPAQKPAA